MNQPRAIAIHHKNPAEKRYHINTICRMDALLGGLPKCAPLCHTHHQIIHHAMNNGGKGLPFDALVDYVREAYPLFV